MKDSAVSHVINGIGHFDVAGPDLDALSAFYGGVLGWQVKPQGPGYALVETPDGSPDGAVVESQDPGLTVGVVVEDLEEAVTAAERHGGGIVMPPTDNGWVVKAQVDDPAGNRLTLIQA
jgi:predicted enzyme related to lactoylglutathione lyase